MVKELKLDYLMTYLKTIRMDSEILICEYSGLPNVEAYQNDICSKCSSLLDNEGICWKCLIESNK